MWLIFIVSAVLVLTPSNVFKASAAPIRFPYGVASGDVTSNSAVLWGQTDQNATIHLEVSRQTTFDTVDFKGSAHATADNDFTTKITAMGLMADTQYYYRWIKGDTYTGAGTFKTAPLDSEPADVHFSWSGDTDSSKNGTTRYFGDWKVLRAALDEHPDFFIFCDSLPFLQG